MANEIQFTDATGRTDYVVITNAVGQFWNTAFLSFEGFDLDNWTNYDIAASEFDGCSIYHADMPAAIPAGVYNVVAKNRAGGSPAESDVVVATGSILWGGTAVVDSVRVLELAEADEVIRTDTIPWTLEYRKKGTTTVLMAKQLRQLDGTAIVHEGLAIGQKVE